MSTVKAPYAVHLVVPNTLSSIARLISPIMYCMMVPNRQKCRPKVWSNITWSNNKSQNHQIIRSSDHQITKPPEPLQYVNFALLLLHDYFSNYNQNKCHRHVFTLRVGWIAGLTANFLGIF